MMVRKTLRSFLILISSIMFMYCSACSWGGVFNSVNKQTVHLYGDVKYITDLAPSLDEEFDLQAVQWTSDSMEERRKVLIERLKTDPPDALILPENEARLLYQEGYLENLLPQYQTSLSERIVPSLIEAEKKNDALSGIPIHTTPLIVYYNKQWFDKANLPYPDETWGWEQFAEISGSLMKSNCSASDEGCYGHMMPFNLSYLGPLIKGFGGEIVNPEDGSAEGYLNGESTEQALLWAKHLITSDKIAPVVWNWNYSSANEMQKSITFYQDAFIQNKIGMIVESTFIYSDFKGALLTDLGVAGIPSSQRGTHYNESHGTLVLSIPKASENKQAAWELLTTLFRHVKVESSEEAASLINFPVIRTQPSGNKDVDIVSQAISNIVNTDLARDLYSYAEPYMERILNSGDWELHNILSEIVSGYELLQNGM